jgi:putative endonuclease
VRVQFPLRVQIYQDMYYVYVLKSLRDGSIYKGYTVHLDKRLHEHNSGKSKFTARKRPWIVIYFEQFETLEEAKKREKYFKTSAGRRILKSKIDPGAGSPPERPE